MNLFLYLITISYITILIIIARKDKKSLEIEKKAIAGGIILSMIYIVYLYAIKPASIYFSTICLGIYAILLTIDTFVLKRYAQNNYTIGILMLFNFILIFSGVEVAIYTLITTTVAILMEILTAKINQKKNGNKKVKINNIPVGYFIGVSNIIILLMMSFVTNYCI